jgi:hypothetical protein
LRCAAAKSCWPARRSSRPHSAHRLLDAPRAERLRELLHQSPRSFGHAQSHWTLQLAAEGCKALLLVWDNAAWHNSQRVRAWIRAHNRRAKREGGVRILVWALPTKSPWR